MKKSKKLRVFEAFAGIGAQHSALKRINIDFEVVGISEWFINAILAYDAIHSDLNNVIDVPSYHEQIKVYLNFRRSRVGPPFGP